MKWLPWGEFWFNSSFNATIKMSPYKALYGQDPPMIIPYPRDSTIIAEVDKRVDAS